MLFGTFCSNGCRINLTFYLSVKAVMGEIQLSFCKWQ